MWCTLPFGDSFSSATAQQLDNSKWAEVYGNFRVANGAASNAYAGVSVAVQPFVSAPVGKVGTGAGAWQGGVAAPISIALPRGFGLGLTPQVAAVRNQSHDGAHLNWTGVAGLSHAVGPISLGTELYVNYDDDPTGGTTRASFDISAAWVPSGSKDLQLDIGLNAGLNRHTPDYEIYAGVARRF